MGKTNLNVRIEKEIKDELDLIADYAQIKRAELVRLAIMYFREHGHILRGLSYAEALEQLHQEYEDVEEKLQQIQAARRPSKDNEANIENANGTILELKKHIRKLEEDLRGWNSGQTEHKESGRSSFEENL